MRRSSVTSLLKIMGFCTLVLTGLISPVWAQADGLGSTDYYLLSVAGALQAGTIGSGSGLSVANGQLGINLSGTAASTATRIATGSSAARTLADAAADSVNVMDFTGIDTTGATDSHTAIQNAINLACTFSPPKAVQFARNGIFDIASPLSIPTGCVGLVLNGTNSELIGDAANVNNPVILKDVAIDGLTINGITFDGSRLSSSSTHGLTYFQAPIRSLTLTNDDWQNAPYENAIWFYSNDTTYQNASLKATTSVVVNGGVDNTVTVSNFTTLNGLHVGSYIVSGTFDDDLYVTGFNSSTGVITFQKTIPDSVPASTNIVFTPAASLTAIASPASNFLKLDTTAGITIGQTVIQPEATCIPVNDRVTSISSSPIGVHLEVNPVCSIASGSALAFASGVSDVLMSNNTFSTIGQGFRYALPATYTSLSDMPAGTSTQVFACASSGCTSFIGLAIGDETGTTQAGLPANDVVTARTLNSPVSGEYTVTYATPSTSTDTPAATYNFNISALAGNGYAWYLAYGAWFSNRDWVENGNTYTNVWSSPVFADNLSDYISTNDICNLNYRQTQSPSVAGSACKAFAGDRNLQEINLVESGATGVGIGFQHDIDVQINGGSYAYNGTDGINVAGGRSFHASRGVSKDNNQAGNAGLAQINQVGGLGNGITLSGGYNYSLAGTLLGATVSDWYSYDDQTVPTQFYGIGKGNNPANTNQPVNVSIAASFTGGGNVFGNINPALLTNFDTAFYATSNGAGLFSTNSGGNTNIQLNYAGTGLVENQFQSGTSAITTSQLPIGYCTDWNNTTAATIGSYCNVGGTIKSESGSGSGLQLGTTTGTAYDGALGAAAASAASSAQSAAASAQTTANNALVKSNNLSDLTNVSVALSNLGLGSMATQSSGSVAITGGSISGLTSLGSVGITLTGSQTAKYVLAAPNGASGAPAFRQLTASDISGLGTAATQASSAFDAAGAATTAVSSLIASQAANLIYASPSSSTGSPSFRALVSQDLPSATSTVQGAMSLTTAANQAPIQSVGTGLTLSSQQVSVTYGTTSGTAAQGNDSRITGACQTSGCTITGYIANSYTGNIATAGTSLSTATALTSALNMVTTCSSGGVKLPTAAPIGALVKVFNRCGSSLVIYPDTSSDTIEGGSAGASVSANNSDDVFFTRISATQWLQ